MAAWEFFDADGVILVRDGFEGKRMAAAGIRIDQAQ
jgi:hypothetical protein